jgi:hypothetical protein
MRGLIAPILLSNLFLLEPEAARASQVLLHALTDTELAENSAGRGIIVHLEDVARTDQFAARAAGNGIGDFFGIQTIALDTGASSITQAATSITLQAALRDVPFQNVARRPD